MLSLQEVIDIGFMNVSRNSTDWNIVIVATDLVMNIKNVDEIQFYSIRQYLGQWKSRSELKAIVACIVRRRRTVL